MHDEGIASQLFAGDVHAPRRRRPNDVVVLAASLVGCCLLAWATALSDDLDPDERLSLAFADPPGWLETIARAIYLAALLYAVGLVVATTVRGGKARGVLRDVLVAAAGTTLCCLGLSRAITGAWPDVLPELVEVDEPVFPAFRLALVATVVWVQAPHLALPVRRFGRWMVIGCAVATVLLGYSHIVAMLAAVLVAVSVVAAVRLAFGSPAGLPTVNQLGRILARLGVTFTELAYDEVQPREVGRASARDPDGSRLTIKVYGRDAADAQRAERFWRSLWYRRAGPAPAISPLRQVEHEALGILSAGRLGVDTGTLVAAGADEAGDAVLVAIRPSGRSLRHLDPDDVDDSVLDAAWAALGQLHERRFAHGSIGPDSVISGTDGGHAKVGFAELDDCSLTAGPLRLGGDASGLLATTAGVVGNERAVDAAVRSWTRPRIEEALPYVQTRALSPEAKRWVDERDVDVDSLRDLLVDRLGIEAPEIVELRRVTWGGVVMVVFAALAANAILSQIAEIGWDTLREEIRGASLGWLVAAFILKLCSYLSGWVSMQSVLLGRVPLAPTTLLQSAKSYVGLVVPTTVGRMAMDVRFLQKLGTPTAVALAQGPLISVVGFVVEVCLLLLTAESVVGDVDTDEVLSFDAGGLILLAVIVAVAAVAIVLAVPRLHQAVVPKVAEALRSLREVARSPRRVVGVFAGELSERLVNSLCLATVIVAFGLELPFASVIFVTVGTGLLAGLAPVPGGIGVAEAMLTGLLTTAGLPADQAFAVAITYRVVTAYLPPALGFFALRWLTTNKYL